MKTASIALLSLLFVSCKHQPVAPRKSVAYDVICSNCQIIVWYKDSLGNVQTTTEQDSFRYEYLVNDPKALYFKTRKTHQSYMVSRILIDNKVVKDDYCAPGDCTSELTY